MKRTAVYDAEIKRGCTFRLLGRLRNPDKSPLDLTGTTGIAQIWDASNPTVVYDFSLSLGGEEGTIQIDLSVAQTVAMATGQYQYHVLLTDPDEQVWCPLEGKATVRGVLPEVGDG